MLAAVQSRNFKRDVKRLKKRGKDMRKLRAVLSLLADAKPLPISFRDHSLKGEWQGYRDLHIEGDWVLIYKVSGNELRLARTGTHADLFDE